MPNRRPLIIRQCLGSCVVLGAIAGALPSPAAVAAPAPTAPAPAPAAPSQSPSPQDEISQQVPAALRILDAYHADAPVPGRRILHVVYWTPADREPAPRYQERLSKIMVETRDFYLREMKRMGFGERTIRLQQDAGGAVRIHLVKGENPYAKYDVKSGAAIRLECLTTLRRAGIDPDAETIVIFCNMSNYDERDGTINQNSPYYASGSLRGGTAWQVDSPILDLDLLDRKRPSVNDGQYGKISVGRYNSYFIGGVVHELGHALGLPHNRERPDQRAAFGTALMGSGNTTYGEERRGEGKGSLLTLAHGLRLAAHPMFTGSIKDVEMPPNAKVTIDEVTRGTREFSVSGQVTADPPAYAVIGYMDPAGNSDYDATTCAAVPDDDGRFTLRCNALEKGKSATLRIVVCQANGGRLGDKSLALPYAVEKDGTIDLSAMEAIVKLTPLTDAVVANDRRAVDTALTAAGKAGLDAKTMNAARVLAGTVRSTRPRPAPTTAPSTTPTTVPTTTPAAPSPATAAGQSAELADLPWAEATVGWGRPAANRLPGASPLLIAGSRLFARGLYAHAPSVYRYDLAGKWTTLTGHAGLADGHDGTAVFAIYGDGNLLWQSPAVRDGALTPFEANVAGVRSLELRVTDGGDGNTADWGLWLEPRLTRK